MTTTAVRYKQKIKSNIHSISTRSKLIKHVGFLLRVALRVRPLLRKLQDEEQSIISYIKDEPQIIFGNEKRSFTFDFVYPPSSLQEEVYRSSITPLLDRFTEG